MSGGALRGKVSRRFQQRPRGGEEGIPAHADQERRFLVRAGRHGTPESDAPENSQREAQAGNSLHFDAHVPEVKGEMSLHRTRETPGQRTERQTDHECSECGDT